ncbi:MAG: hypothetical protein IJ583_12475, partial [Firmicutes bacterium]|nr:hypothetical protein [Bacillota bacterium]
MKKNLRFGKIPVAGLAATIAVSGAAGNLPVLDSLGMNVAVYAALDPISYIDAPIMAGVAELKPETTNEYTVLTQEILNSPLAEGTYYISSGINVTNRITLAGNVKIILKDGTSSTFEGGIAAGNHTVTIYGQENQSGELIIGSKSKDLEAVTSTTDVTINGGNIKITGYNAVANSGDNGSDAVYADNLFINGGNVEITAGSIDPNSSSTTSYGLSGDGAASGKLFVSGGSLTIKGGDGGYHEVMAHGFASQGSGAVYGAVNVTAGKLVAIGGKGGRGTLESERDADALPSTLTTSLPVYAGSSAVDAIKTSSDQISGKLYVEVGGEELDPVEYLKETVSDSGVTFTKETTDEYKPLTQEWVSLAEAEASAGDKTITLLAGTYYLNENIEVSYPLLFDGDVVFILKDGATPTFKGGISAGGHNFTVYAQEGGTGKLVLKYTELYDVSIYDTVIGASSITINGGNIEIEGFQAPDDSNREGRAAVTLDVNGANVM